MATKHITLYVKNCTDCQDGECAREEHAPLNLPKLCSCTPCKSEPVEFAGDCLGNVHAACQGHKQYLDGWIRDVASEVESDSRASARFERYAYGEDY